MTRISWAADIVGSVDSIPIGGLYASGMAGHGDLRKLGVEQPQAHGRAVPPPPRRAGRWLDRCRAAPHRDGAPLVSQVTLTVSMVGVSDAVGGTTRSVGPTAVAIPQWAPLGAERPMCLSSERVIPDVASSTSLRNRPAVPWRACGRGRSTTGGSVRTEVDVLRQAIAEVAGVAAIVDRGAEKAVRATGLSY